MILSKVSPTWSEANTYLQKAQQSLFLNIIVVLPENKMGKGELSRSQEKKCIPDFIF